MTPATGGCCWLLLKMYLLKEKENGHDPALSQKKEWGVQKHSNFK